MNRLLLLSIVGAALGGCASANTPVGSCTSLISVEGGLLQFCQTANKIEVSESGIDTNRAVKEAQIVDDPKTLQTIANDLHASPRFKASRALVARACLVKDKTYITIAANDLKRITAGGPSTTPDDPN